MKKCIMTLAAVCALALTACNEKPAAAGNEQQGDNTPVEQTDNNGKTDVAGQDVKPALQPTGDVDKDAQACAEQLIKLLDNTDFTTEEGQKQFEQQFTALGKAFDTYYEQKGKEAAKAWDEAGKKAAERVNLAERMTQKIMEGVQAAKQEAGQAAK